MSTIMKVNMKLDAPITDPLHIVNKAYVDSVIMGKVKDPVRVATTDNLPCTYDSSGKILTSTTNGVLSIDTITCNVNDRVLVKNQTDAKQNGIYTVGVVGNASTPFQLVRAEDFLTNVKPNILIGISEGATNHEIVYQLTNDGTITIDTTGLIFAKAFTGSGGSGVQKYVEDIVGNGTATDFPITHGLNTRNLTYSVYDNSYNRIVTDIDLTNNSTVNIKFAAPVANGAVMHVTIIG